MRRSPSVHPSAVPAVATAAAEFREIPLGEIHLSSSLPNPRTTFDEAALADLAASIRRHGVLQPIVVRPHPTGTGYEVIAGGRRLRAAHLAQLSTIPSRVAVL